MAAAIAASEALDNDTDASNEIELPDDSAATPGDVLATDAAGTYSWITPSLTDTNDFINAGALNTESLELTGTGGAGATVDLSPFALDTDVAAAIAASEALDNDTDASNEIELPDDSAAAPGDVLATDAAGTYSWITPSLTDTNDFINAGALNTESLELTGTGGAGATVDLSPFALDTDVAAAIAASEALDNDTDASNEIELPDDSAATPGDVLATDAAGTYSWITPSLTDTNDFINAGALNTESLELTGTGGAGATVDLSPFALDTDVAAAIAASEALDGDKDDTNEIQVLSIIGNDIQLSKGGGSVTLTGTGSLTSSSLDITGGANTLFGNVIIEIPSNSITQGEIGPNAIGANEIQSNAVSSDEIEDGTVLNDDIGPGIDGAKIIPDFGAQNVVTTGDVSANSFISATATYPDYVFQQYFLGNSSLNKDYKFSTLKSVESFIKKNHHLPGIKSAEEIAENNGKWNLTEGALTNLEKIEELFLHTIEQEKKIESLKAENETLSQEMEALKQQVAAIKKMLEDKTQE